MSEEKRYKMKKVIDGNTIKYRKVEVAAEDLLQEKDVEIKRLHTLIDSLREQVTQLEQEKQRLQLRDAPVDEASSYNIYS
jgi:DNA repair exonuclease SbcCD ATPase subunit